MLIRIDFINYYMIRKNSENSSTSNGKNVAPVTYCCPWPGRISTLHRLSHATIQGSHACCVDTTMRGKRAVYCWLDSNFEIEFEYERLWPTAHGSRPHMQCDSRTIRALACHRLGSTYRFQLRRHQCFSIRLLTTLWHIWRPANVWHVDVVKSQQRTAMDGVLRISAIGLFYSAHGKQENRQNTTKVKTLLGNWSNSQLWCLCCNKPLFDSIRNNLLK